MKTFRLRLSWKNALVEVEMRNSEVGMKYVKDGEVRWTPVVRKRRKMSVRNARSEDGDNSGNSNVRLNLIEGRKSLVRYREVNGIPGIYIRGSFASLR